VIAHLDHGVLHLLDLDRTLLRSLPNERQPGVLRTRCAADLLG
jgi:hypothetical protein